MKKKILLIEDDLGLCQIYRTNLEIAGFEVEEAHDGKVGLVYALHHSPHFILLDLMLPGLNGLELLKIVKETATTKDIPVLVLTNLGSNEVEEAKKLGACDCLIKGKSSPEEVVKKVKEILIGPS